MHTNGQRSGSGRTVSPSEKNLTESSDSAGTLIGKITAQFSALVRDEIRFASLNAKMKVLKIGLGGILLACAGVLALYLLEMLLLAAAFGLSAAVPLWLAFLIMAGILLVTVLILALLGIRALKSSRRHAVNPKAGLAKDIAVLKKGIKK